MYGYYQMKKILSIAIMLFFIAFGSQLPGAKDDDAGKDNQKETADSLNYKFDYKDAGQFRLFQLSQYLNHQYLQPLFLFRGLNLNMELLPDYGLQSLRRPKKRFGRAVLEGVGHIVYATASYWIRQDVMKEDWEYQWTWEDQKKRFLFVDGMRFDSNTFTFNWTHSLAGALYYNYARANNINPLGSFLFSFGISYFWEFVVEFKEVISINDVIGTPMGGINIGESMFQLGRYFRSRRPTFFNKILRILSNPVLSMNEWIDRKRIKNQYAFKDDYWHDCRLFAGSRFDSFSNGASDAFLQVGMENQLVILPGYGMPGAVSGSVKRTLFAEFDVGGVIGEKGLYEFNIFAKSVLFGYFSQDVRTKGTGTMADYIPGMRDDMDNDDREGYALFLGVATTFDMIKNDPLKLPGNGENPDIPDYPDREDKHVIVNLGPTVDFSLFHRDWKIRLVADAYGDFSLIHSHAFKRYSELFQFGQTKSTLENHGYYYALGVTLSSMLQVNYSNFELKGKLKYHYFNSIEGWDRFQKDMADEDDFDLKDQRLRYNMSLGYRIPNTSLQLVLGMEEIDRRGSVEDFSRHSNERRSYLQIKYIF